MIKQRYRKEYDGEFIILGIDFVNNKKIQKREWIPNPIINQHISGRAAIIGDGLSIKSFPVHKLEKHKGGLLGKKRLQTYGSGDTFRKINLNFYVTNRPDLVAELATLDSVDKDIVYTTGPQCMRYPGKFYPVPYAVSMHEKALAAYLACFDGHEELFFLGYDFETIDKATQGLINDMVSVISTYSAVKFWFVTDNPYLVAEPIRNHSNVDCMNYRKFISYCDV